MASWRPPASAARPADAIYGYACADLLRPSAAYSDIAIAWAALLGLRLPAQLEQPYRAQVDAGLWRRCGTSRYSTWPADYRIARSAATARDGRGPMYSADHHAAGAACGTAQSIKFVCGVP